MQMFNKYQEDFKKMIFPIIPYCCLCIISMFVIVLFLHVVHFVSWHECDSINVCYCFVLARSAFCVLA
jgi:hypothetical protein